ncbi:phage baseplate assembly protein V [Marinicrinis sediminis]|uniref:Phage baseplate assembly protein V n=1 Tax=Marinicrinis sediminis TaxID=1652465 RepID=A0ABW5RFC2_9BACL
MMESLNGQETMSPIIPGVMVGIVTNNKDPEKLARVKLKLPLREGENETDWVRIATMMVGKDKGSLFIPEVGDEVLVAFHLGEIRKPYVLGMLWNKKEGSPKADDKNNLRKIKSRSGHELIFDDTDGEEKVTIQTKSGTLIEWDDAKDTILMADKNNKNKVTVEGGSVQQVSIECGSNKVTVNGKGDVSIESVKSLKMKSVQLDIEATGSMNIKAGASLNIQSNGMLAVKGSMVKIN